MNADGPERGVEPRFPAVTASPEAALSRRGPVLDVGCGDGRLASRVVERGVAWIGLDSSPGQLAASLYRPVVLADMRNLPFRDDVFGEVAHLWCHIRLEDPVVAIAEAKRLLRRGGCYYASTSASGWACHIRLAARSGVSADAVLGVVRQAGMSLRPRQGGPTCSAVSA